MTGFTFSIFACVETFGTNSATIFTTSFAVFSTRPATWFSSFISCLSFEECTWFAKLTTCSIFTEQTIFYTLGTFTLNIISSFSNQAKSWEANLAFIGCCSLGISYWWAVLAIFKKISSTCRFNTFSRISFVHRKRHFTGKAFSFLALSTISIFQSWAIHADHSVRFLFISCMCHGGFRFVTSPTSITSITFCAIHILAISTRKTFGMVIVHEMSFTTIFTFIFRAFSTIGNGTSLAFFVFVKVKSRLTC